MTEKLEDKVSKKGIIVHSVSAGLKTLAGVGSFIGSLYLSRKAEEAGIDPLCVGMGFSVIATYLLTGAADFHLAREKYKSLKEGKTEFTYNTEDPGYINSSTKVTIETLSMFNEIF